MRTHNVESQNFDERPNESLQSTKCYAKYSFDYQPTPNCIIRISIWSAGSVCPLDRIPFSNSLFIEPKSYASPINQRLAILFPVAGTILVFLLGGSFIFLGSHVEPQIFSLSNKKFIDSLGLKARRILSAAIYATTPLTFKITHKKQ